MLGKSLSRLTELWLLASYKQELGRWKEENGQSVLQYIHTLQVFLTLLWTLHWLSKLFFSSKGVNKARVICQHPLSLVVWG